MFTGLLPRDHGVRINGQNLRRDIPTLPQVLSDNGYRTHSAGKLHLTAWDPDPENLNLDIYPENMQSWNSKKISRFPTPYYGFQTVDFVGGHTSYAWGEYINWLTEKGGEPEMLTMKKALEEPSGAPFCYKMSLPVELHYNRYISDSTIRFLEQSAEESKPFFAWCSFPDPHFPIAPPEPYCSMYNPEHIPFPARRKSEMEDMPPFYKQILSAEFRPLGVDYSGVQEKHFKEMIALTYGMITHIDKEIGRIMDTFHRCGLWENTMVVFISDHGDMMGDHGLMWKGVYTYQGVINIPTIAYIPYGVKGQVSGSLISQIDLMPSILDFCNIPMPGDDWKEKKYAFERGSMVSLESYPGKSWLSILKGEAKDVRNDVIIENDDPSTGYHARCLVTENFRITIYPGTPYGELFDLRTDPHELYNLWDKEDYCGIKQELLLKLLHSYCLHTPFYPIPYGGS